MASKEILRPVLKGANIKKWAIKKPENYIIYTYTGVQIEQYKAIKSYLEKHRGALENVYEARNGSKEWYELRPCSYYDSFFKESIIWTRLSNTNCFAISKLGEFSIDSTSFAIGENLYYYCCLLNSNLIYFYFKLGSVIWGKDGIKWFGEYFDNLPIIKANDSKEIFEIKAKKIISLKEKNIDNDISKHENQLDIMVYKLYRLSYYEVKLTDPQIEKIISREDYESKSIEELAEYEIKL
ncbi:hypothetical protein ES705_51042 [subsurface metagenome]